MLLNILEEKTMLKLVLGSPPRGADYFGREALIETLWSRLERDNVLLAAPRRFGKTGAMFRLLDDPRPPYRPLFINVENITSAADFMVELMAALLRDRHFARAVRGLWSEAREFGAFLRELPATIDLGGFKIELRQKTDVAHHWADYGEKVMALLARTDPPLLLLIDEFAIMVNAIAKRSRGEVVELLRWFRAARIAPDTRTRFVLGSSINLVTTLDAMGLVDTVNDLWIERLKPFPRATAGRFVDEIFAAHEVEIEAEVREAILDLVGEPIPYLLSVYLTAVLDRCRDAGEVVSVEMAQAAFEEDLLSGAVAVTFQHYRSRLDEYYSDLEARAAKAVLATLSRSEEPVLGETLFQIYCKTGQLEPGGEHSESFLQLMNKLENDFYITARDGGFVFFSRVLRLWWRTHFGFQRI